MTTLNGPFLPFGPSWWTWIKTLLWTFDFLFHILVVHECGVDFRCFPWTGRLIWHIVRNVIPVRNANFLWMAAQLIHPLTHFLLVHLPCQRSLPLNRDTNLLSSSDKNMAPISYATKWMITTTNWISFLFSLPINFRWLSWYPSNRTSVGSVYASIFLVLSRRSLVLGNWNRWMAVLMDNNGKNLLDCSFSPFIVGADRNVYVLPTQYNLFTGPAFINKKLDDLLLFHVSAFSSSHIKGVGVMGWTAPNCSIVR